MNNTIPLASRLRENTSDKARTHTWVTSCTGAGQISVSPDTVDGCADPLAPPGYWHTSPVAAGSRPQCSLIWNVKTSLLIVYDKGQRSDTCNGAPLFKYNGAALRLHDNRVINRRNVNIDLAVRSVKL